jgi:NAD(P)H-hydrate repair Nnr-like enzyme with NAD(P)H-hydrate dehydratase domain
LSNGAHELSLEDLEAEEATALPEREAMSKVHLGAGLGIDNFAMPINEATAMNINSTDAVAIADADQIVIITQADVD